MSLYLSIESKNDQKKSVQAIPLTLPSADRQGSLVQLFKFKDKLVGGVLDLQGKLTVVPGSKIVNPLNSMDCEDDLLQRLEGSALRSWDLVFDTSKLVITLWPHLMAEGKYRGTDHYRIYTVWDMLLEVENRMNKLQGRHTTDGKPGEDDTKGALNPRHYKDAAEEAHGKPSKYDHQQEVQDYLRGAKKLRDQIAFKLKEDKYRFSIDERRLVERALHEARKLARDSGTYIAGLRQLYDPSFRAFREVIRANGLEGTYNSSHPNKQISRGLGDRNIGGVGNEVGIIEGLFSTASGLEEEAHFFYLPSEDGTMPFRSQELAQILRELAVGIYVHDTVPFFSMHFNSDANMYPVIHPAYEHTLVGRVISLLDYYMKGFLNGGFFDEAFLSDWQRNKSHDEKFLKSKCIDLHNYCKKHLGASARYMSVREVIDNVKANTESAKDDPPLFSDYSGFRSSFRIIAKQNSFKKTGALFELDGGFDVLYTIEPDPSYEEALQKYRYEHGSAPPGYERLVNAYKWAQHEIATVMPRLPLFKELFEQLKVINFFCYYLKTLKKAHKIPLLTPMQSEPTVGAFPLFPHLPLRRMVRETVQVDFGLFFKTMPVALRERLENYLFEGGTIAKEPPHDLVEAALASFTTHLKNTIKRFTLEEDQKFIDQHRTFVVDFLINGRKVVQDFKNRPTTAPKPDLVALKQRKSEILKNLDIVEKNLLILAENSYVMRHGAMDYRLKIDEDITKQKELKKNLQDTLDFHERRMRQVQACNGLVDIYTYGADFTESGFVVEFFSEQPPEQREENKKIVGGCGFDLKVKPLTQGSLEPSLMTQTIAAVEVRKDEELVPITLAGEVKAKGHAFRLHIADYYGSSHKEFQWMAELHSQESETQIEQKMALINSIVAEDEEHFLDLLSRFKECDVELFGMHAIHHAASTESPLFLQKLLEAKHPISKCDLHGLLPIHWAAKAGRLENIRALKYFDYPNPNGLTPLHVAVLANQYEAVELLLQLGANPNLKTTYGMTPLYSAVHEGYEKIALLLISNPATQVDIGLEDKSTPLFVAVEAKMSKVVAGLLKRGANCSNQRIDTYTPLHLAAKMGLLEICQRLILAGADVNAKLKSGKTALHLAAAGFPQIVSLLLNHGANPSLRGWDGATALMWAIVNGDTLSAEQICNYCGTKSHLKDLLTLEDLKKETPLIAALQRRQYSVAELLLKHGVPLTYTFELFILLCKAKVEPAIIASLLPQDNLPALALTAQKHGHNQLVSYLILFKSLNLAQVPTDEEGWGIYHYAAQHDHIDLIKRFIKSPHLGLRPTLAAIAAEYNSCRSLGVLLDESSSFALFQAVANGHEKAADLIIHKIFDPNIPLDQDKTTAAHVAAKQGDVRMLEFLRSRGARFCLVDSHQKSPIHYAVDGNFKEAIDYFLDQKNEIALPDNLLEYAAAKGLTQLVQRLIERGYTKINEAACAAIGQDAIDAFMLLCQHGADLAPQLLVAAKLGNAKILKLILAKHDSPEKQKALQIAVEAGHEECVSLLLRAGAVPDPRPPALLHHIQLLLEGKEEVLGNRKELIVQALTKGHVATSDFLRLIESLPPNQPMQFCINGKMKILPLLHLIHEVAAKKPHKARYLEAFLALPGVDRHVKCAQGCTLAHLLAMQEEDLDKSWDLTVQDAMGRTPLHYNPKAAVNVAAGKNVDIEDKTGATPLFVAIGNKNVQDVELLLEKGANPNYCNIKLLTPLEVAVTCDHSEIAKLLLKHGAKMNHHTNPLLLAILLGRTNMAQMLITEGANVNLRDKKGQTPLHAAAASGNLAIMRLLLSAGAHISAVDCEGNSVAHYAAHCDNVELIDFLVAHGISMSRASHNKETPLHVASRKSSLQMMTKLVEAGAQIDAKNEHGHTALGIAAASQNKEAVRYFRDLRIMHRSETRCEAIQMALVMDALTSLKEFYQDDDEVDTMLDPRGRTALHYAAQYGSALCAIFLIQQGADLKKEDLDHNSPLDLAVAGKHLSLVRYFVHQLDEIDLNAAKIDKKPYLHQACELGAVELAALFLQLGASIEKVDYQGMKPVQIAASKQNYALIRLLAAFGADLSHMPIPAREDIRSLVERYRHFDKERPVHTAVHLNEPEHLALLVQVHDINAKDANGQTPLQIALRANNLSMLIQLLNLGARVTERDSVGNLALYHMYRLSDRNAFHLVLKSVPKTALTEPTKEMLQACTEAKNGQMAPFLNLVNLGHPIANEKFSLLHVAINEANLVLVQLLFDWFGPDLVNIDFQDAQGRSALELAFLVGNREIFAKIYELMPKNAQLILNEMQQAIARDDATSFFNQIHKGQIVGPALILRAAASGAQALAKIIHTWFQGDLEAKDHEARTPLYLAATNGHSELAAYLLEAGAKVDVSSRSGTSLLQALAQSNRKELFMAIYAKLPKHSRTLQRNRSATIGNCFHHLHAGYPLKEVLLFAAKSNSVDFIRSLHTLIPEQVDLEAIGKTAREAKSTEVLEFHKTVTPASWCPLL